MLKEGEVRKVACVLVLRVHCGESDVTGGGGTQSRDDPSSDRDRTSCHGNPGS